MVTNSHIGFTRKPLTPHLTFLTLVLHVLPSAWGRSGGAEEVSPITTGFTVQKEITERLREWQSQGVKHQSLTSLGKGQSCCPIWPTELRVLQGTFQRALVPLLYSTIVQTSTINNMQHTQSWPWVLKTKVHNSITFEKDTCLIRQMFTENLLCARPWANINT